MSPTEAGSRNPPKADYRDRTASGESQGDATDELYSSDRLAGAPEVTWGLGHLQKPGFKKQVEFLERRGLFEPNRNYWREFRRRPRNLMK